MRWADLLLLEYCVHGDERFAGPHGEGGVTGVGGLLAGLHLPARHRLLLRQRPDGGRVTRPNNVLQLSQDLLLPVLRPKLYMRKGPQFKNKFVNSDGQWHLSFYKIVTHLLN